MPTSIEFRKKRYRSLTRIADKFGGAVLARSYTNLRILMAVRCERGHRFKMTPKNILRGLWCHQCRPLSRQAEFLEYAHITARKQEGKCLATAYENARVRLPWMCKSKHRWEASFDNVVNKESWCPTCAAATISDRKKRWWRNERTKIAKRRTRH